MKTLNLTILCGLFLVSYPAYSGSIIKCEGADGSITFADTRCPANQVQTAKKTYQQRKAVKQTSQKNLEKAAEFPDDGSTPRMSGYFVQSQLAQVFSSIMPIKLSMTEYFMVSGRWPEKLQDMRFNPADMTSSLIDATELDRQGRLNIKLNKQFGENKAIWLYPKMVMGGTQIEWLCYANFPKNILSNPVGQELCSSRYF